VHKEINRTHIGEVLSVWPHVLSPKLLNEFQLFLLKVYDKGREIISFWAIIPAQAGFYKKLGPLIVEKKVVYDINIR
jgi:hypothetical protein